ncbi:nucleotidyltransferase AbiEii toxin of type IV toxin-antitoxin system [Rathayibacter sp. PhB127]|uniref:nucleotidyl transferase AbiEii/AbiGii toxin family protein n=1 Tax=Rathayibacter sp. PhB127 TaxID=2485176 RepID=UPI000F4B6AC8|nr:nucleotidyl transferase AbiEii/AbiGii toxin family protein [Rathayibacter sp. PhB127]ROS22179.1 nucleotidyltransferase AbiEii toxin of type IV toxin-antitoxin system [Rathayibacter sp. PhB127]
MSDTTDGYRDGTAAGAAIRAAAQRSTQGRSPSIDALIRQTTFDRFLCRVFAVDDGAFVLKGGTGMLARMPRGRSTRDIDLAATDQDLETAVAELIERTSLDLGDHFRFVFTTRTTQIEGDNQPYTSGCRLAFDSYLGVTPRGTVNIDLAVGYDPTAPAERVAPSSRLTRLRFVSHDYLLYPLADQVSDKVCATLQLYGERQRPSSREKDLVDLTLIASSQPLDAAQLRVALATEFRRRGLEPIDAFTVPSHWGAAYRRLAGATALSTIAPTVVDAVAVMSRLLDPILGGTVTSGTWSPARRIWD